MSVHPFGRLADGTEISEIRLATAAGANASVITLGASVRDLVVPLTGGSGRRVVLGFPTLEGYLANPGYIGVTAGRHASRIGRGLLPIGGVRYQLTLNDGGRHHLHGGTTGFSRRPWRILAEDAVSVTLGLTSPDGDQGYPGTVEARCTYRLEEPATLRVVMTATADAPTAVSLAHHSYFTLSPRRSIRDHRLAVNARHYTPLDAERIPTGEIRAVAGTVFDFRAPRPISNPGPDAAFLYDCNLVLDRADGPLGWAATLQAPDASLRMDVHTAEPCLVFYDGAGLAAGLSNLDGEPNFPHAGLCLEPIRFPDNPNHPWFPSSVLRPGETYRQVTEYRFAAG